MTANRPASWPLTVVFPLTAVRIETRRPSAANSPRCFAMYSPAESTAGTAATLRLVVSSPPGAAEPPPPLQPAASAAQTHERGQPGDGPEPETTRHGELPGFHG